MLVLSLGHAVASVVLLASSHRPAKERARAVWACSGVGVLLAGVLVAGVGSGQHWRALALRESATVVGVAVATAWLVAAIVDLGRGRWEVGALIGVASTALILASSSEWLVPGLLFWFCGSVAIGVLGLQSATNSGAHVALFASDLALGAGLIASDVGGATWRMPVLVDGWPGYVLLLAALLRLGALPRVGVWGLLGSPAAAAIPLLVGGAFALPLRTIAVLGGWPAVVVLAGAVAIAAFAAVTTESPSISGIAPWPVLVCLAGSVLAAGVRPAAAVTAALSAGVVSLWPHASRSAAPARALLLSFTPVTAAFSILASGRAAAFQRVVSSQPLLAAFPWVICFTLLLVAVVLGATLGARLARQGGDSLVDEASYATWGLVGASILVALAPTEASPLEDAVRASSGVVLAALLCGGATVWLVRKTTQESTATEVLTERFSLAPIFVTGRLATALAAMSVAFVAMTAMGLAWITLIGLTQGFL